MTTARSNNAVDVVGPTKYAYTASGQLWTEGGPFSNDTVTNTCLNRLRIAQVSDPAPGPGWRTDFAYDGLGRLRRVHDYVSVEDVPEEWIWEFWDGHSYVYDGWRVIQERTLGEEPSVSYTRGTDLSGTLEGAGGIGGLLARTHGYNYLNGNWSTHNFYHADGNGNITYLVNSSQALAASYRYDPYGNLVSWSGGLAAANTYRFSSKEIHVNSGMYYYGYRWYDPFLQRWPNRDPLGEPGFELLISISGVSNVLADGPNSYSFVNNIPTRFIDPFGLASWSDCMQDCMNEQLCNAKTAVNSLAGLALGGLGNIPVNGRPVAYWLMSRFIGYQLIPTLGRPGAAIGVAAGVQAAAAAQASAILAAFGVGYGAGATIHCFDQCKPPVEPGRPIIYQNAPPT